MIGLITTMLGVGVLSALLIGCEKGHYTDDRHYVGNPERVESAGDQDTQTRWRRNEPCER